MQARGCPRLPQPSPSGWKREVSTLAGVPRAREQAGSPRSPAPVPLGGPPGTAQGKAASSGSLPTGSSEPRAQPSPRGWRFKACGAQVRAHGGASGQSRPSSSTTGKAMGLVWPQSPRF